MAKCPKGDCVGETGRAFRARLKEHNNTRRVLLTEVGGHLKNSGHSQDRCSTTVITRETDILGRRIREAIKVQGHGPTLNQDSRCKLPAVFLDILSRD